MSTADFMTNTRMKTACDWDTKEKLKDHSFLDMFDVLNDEQKVDITFVYVDGKQINDFCLSCV